MGNCFRVCYNKFAEAIHANGGLRSVFSAGLYNGGLVSRVYGMSLSLTGTLALAASLAEMASPIAGAQYHWIAIFAPPKYAAFITWTQGTTTCSRLEISSL